jgi:hypothetical protein
MTTISHDPATPEQRRSPAAEFLRLPEMWASLGISMMWLAVIIDAVYGPNLVSSGGTTILSAIFVAFFAWLAAVSVARYGFGNRNEGRRRSRGRADLPRLAAPTGTSGGRSRGRALQSSSSQSSSERTSMTPGTVAAVSTRPPTVLRRMTVPRSFTQ